MGMVWQDFLEKWVGILWVKNVERHSRFLKRDLTKVKKMIMYWSFQASWAGEAPQGPHEDGFQVQGCGASSLP